MGLRTTLVTREGVRPSADAPIEVLEVPLGTPLLAAVPVAQGDVTVLLEPGLVLPPNWLRDLCAAFDEPWVAAAGPVCNDGGGAQRVDAGAAWDCPMTELGAVAEAWRSTHLAGRHGALRLDPWCVALRTAVAAPFAAGARDLDELCRRVVTAGHQCAVAEDVYAHRRTAPSTPPTIEEELRHLAEVASRGRVGPLLSAALIVKDEEENLPRCLASLSGLVDEVVVYDTGSADRTVEIARRAGALVIEGYWDDNFSRARNAAIERCTGEWVLSIDADEVATGDRAAARYALEVNWGVDVLVVPITNMLGSGESERAGLDHRGPRLLRRERCRWRFRLHEQPFTPDGTPPMRGAQTTQLRLLHSGYTDDTTDAREKVERNIRVAEEGLAELVDPTPGELVANLVNLGRSYTWAGRNEDALACYERAIAVEEFSGYRRTALAHGFEALMALGRLDEAAGWLALLREASSASSQVPRYLEGLLLFRQGEVEAALACFDGIDELADDDGTARGADFVAKVRGMAQLAHGDWGDALESLIVAATSGGAPAWGPMAVAAVNAGVGAEPVAALVTDGQLPAACLEVAASVPAAAPAFLEALWQRFPRDPRLLAAAARLGDRLPVARALDWSARLRSAGAAEHCPLRAIVASPAVPASERLRAAAVLDAAFGEAPPAADVASIAQGLRGPRVRAALAAELAPLSPLVATRISGGLPPTQGADASLVPVPT